MAKDRWTTISVQPLTGPLDTRSRPADIPAGGFRWKLNFQATTEGKLCRRAGHARFFSDAESYTNHDHHRQGATREPITGLFESTSNDGTRRLFDSTQSRVSLLDTTTGLYTDILTGLGSAGSRWKMAELQNTLVLTNNVDPVKAYDIGTGALIGDIGPDGVTKAKVVVQFNGFILLMNVEEDGERKASRIHWSDINLPTTFNAGADDSLSEFQDLEYGDEIIGAAPMVGALYIYTRRSIWRATVSGEAESIFSFVRVYSEPKNQTGCLAFPNTLCNTGSEHWYMGRDGIYKFNPYIPAPEREDWMHRADGVIYKKADTIIDMDYCESPIAEYRPETRELWFSWPSTGVGGINNWTLVAQVEHKTADVLDTGYTALANFRRNSTVAGQCNEVQDFLGVSNVDWAIKSIGLVYHREYAALADTADPTVDLPALADYSQLGYNSILRGMIPLGLMDREKIVRNVLVDHDTNEQSDPCVMRLRIGNSYSLVDPNDTDNVCTPVWKQIPDLPLTCPDALTISEMIARNQRPSNGTEWRIYQRGRFLYFEFTIANADHTEAIGGDTCLQRIDFEALAMPKA